MPKATFYSKLMLLAIVLTLLALAAQPFIPKRVLKLNANDFPDGSYWLMPANDDPESKKVSWVSWDQIHFHCKFSDSDHNQACSFNYTLAKDFKSGIDLTKFDSLTFKMDYLGPETKIRVAIRGYEAGITNMTDANSGKYHSVSIKTNDVNTPVIIGINEFTVADWWVEQFQVPRNKSHPNLTRVGVMAIEPVGDFAGKELDIKISELQFVGDWISKESWYLLIQLSWLAAGLIYTIRKLIALTRRERQQDAKISELIIHNFKLANETDKFRRLSTIDALTNAFNRYGIEQIIESLELKLEATAIIMFDIDHFKRINDRRGHDVGDLVLQQVCEIVLSKTRSTDKLGRWGGEEFILICPNTSVGMATALAEKLRLLIFDKVFEPSNPVAVTASFGVAAIRQGEHFADSLKRADEALYKAKNMGRNCVIVAADDMPSYTEPSA